LTTKLHLAVDGRGRPLSIVVTEASGTTAPNSGGCWTASGCHGPAAAAGRAGRPDHLVGDKGYASPGCRRLLGRRGIPHTIPERSDQRAQRARRPGRPPGFDRERYRGRNVVERGANRLKQWRGIATRYDKRASNYRAAVVIASLLWWLD
jgi:transposase